MPDGGFDADLHGDAGDGEGVDTHVAQGDIEWCRREYDLTEEGWSLVPVLTALYEWGQKRADRAGITLP
ncbi:winged helix-turn-helix transcriptional regulator [Nocardia sp. NPDC049707]|uniref:winged helix-turn-helix transcriptional regulator n=1 Tax=Nocardia sp. NPDC049707 TaxID=3154735 RepID=UPI0034203295